MATSLKEAFASAVAEKGVKSPWNPSRRAIARVRDPLPAPTTCPHCGGPVKIVKNSTIYGRDYGDWPWAYLCKPCDAYVGMHPYTNIPLGTLAKKAVRDARNYTKTEFNALWLYAKDRRGERTKAYEWLANQLGMTTAECHFGLFDEAMCERVDEIIESTFLGRPRDWRPWRSRRSTP